MLAQTTGASEATEQAIKQMAEELRKKNQTLLVKDAEIDSLKAMMKELRETID